MTKSREKLLEKAKKKGFSEDKIAFLMQENQLPEYFFNEVYYFVKHHDDEELNNCGYQLLYDLFNKTRNKKEFSHLMWCIAFVTCSCKQLAELITYINSSEYEVYQYVNIYHVLNYCLEDTLETFKRAAKEKNPKAYLKYMGIGEHDKIITDYENRHQYAHYFTENTNSESWQDEWNNKCTITKCLCADIPFEKALAYDFDDKRMHEEMFQSMFPSLSKKLENMEYSLGYYQMFKDEESGFDRAKNIIDCINYGIQIYIPCNIKKILIKKEKTYIKIIEQDYKKVYASKSIAIKGDEREESVTITPDNNSKSVKREMLIYYSHNKIACYSVLSGKVVPLSLRNLMQFDMAGVVLEDLAHNGSMIFKDFLRRPIQEELCCPPVLVNDCIGKQNMNQYFAKYKNGQYFNWNKGNYQQYYVLMKSLDRVAEEDWMKVVNCKNSLEMYDFKSIEKFISSYIQCNVKKHGQSIDNNDSTVIEDYINMCKENRHKVEITLCSKKKIQRKHDLEMSVLTVGKNTLKVPKDSKYNRLRKILPKEFDWIKNKNRLIKEGRIQGHCVASYADKITKDNCAIYSVIHNGIRYTLEFIYDKKSDKYTLTQCQSKSTHMWHPDFDRSVLAYIRGISNQIA